MTGLFKFFYLFFSCHFRYDLVAASSSDCLAEAPEKLGCCYLDKKMGFLLRADFLISTLACLAQLIRFL